MLTTIATKLNHQLDTLITISWLWSNNNECLTIVGVQLLHPLLPEVYKHKLLESSWMSSHDLQHNQRTCSNQLPLRPKRRSWPLDRQVVGGILNCGPQSLLRILTRLYSHSEKQFNGGPCYKVRLQREHPITYLYRICFFILRTLWHRVDRYRPNCLDDRSNSLYLFPRFYFTTSLLVFIPIHFQIYERA